jgi:hypothetical protein
MKKLLIGGQALRTLGSTRHTNDFDYLVNDLNSKKPFITSEEVDYINANGHKFFNEIWKMEANNSSEIASPQALLELKAFSLVQHCQNFNFKKADEAEFDIKFLVRNFSLELPKIVKKYVTDGEYSEIKKACEIRK